MAAGIKPRQRFNDLVDRLRLWLQRPASLGARGERAAAKMLKHKGYRVLAHNLRNRFGEIDLLAMAPDRRTIVIIEVKSAQNTDSLPEQRVDQKKQKRLTALAAQVVRRYKLQNRPVRFDVIGVNLPPNADPIIRHYVAAFDSHI